MSSLNLAQNKALALAAKQAELLQKDKEAARLQLMRIQLILARSKTS
jgi:hypothetical protein